MLSPKELRQRWTTELTSLRRRAKPSKEQEGRIICLQKFLAALDPLRKFENERLLDSEFKRKLSNEIQMQEAITNKDYQDRVYARILVAMTGKPLGQPGDICRKTETATWICEDHGEEYCVVIERMVNTRLLRKDPVSGGLSLSTVGANLMERIAETKIVSTPLQNGNSKLFEKLDHESRLKVINLTAERETGSALRETPSISATVPAKKTPWVPVPKKRTSAATYLKFALKRKEASTLIINNLTSMKAITKVSWNLTVEEHEDLPAVWTCQLSMWETGERIFVSKGPSRKAAANKAGDLALNKLKTLPDFCCGNH